MPSLKVPQRFISGIVRIAEISQEGFDELLTAVRQAPSLSNSRELLAWLDEGVPSLSEGDRKDIITSIVPMIRVQRNSGVAIEEFVSDVWDSVSEEARTRKIDHGLFESRTAQLVGEAALDIASARIADVKAEVERNFCKIRILTDLRPAFKANPEDPPSEMALIHSFQFGYHDGMGKHQEFYLSLDSDDLETLKKAIVEAEIRAEALESLFSKTGVTLHR